MSQTITSKSRLIDVTLGDLVDYLHACGFVTRTDSPGFIIKDVDEIRAPRPELVGIKGLAEYLQMSRNTVGRYYREGVFDGAVIKVGDRNLRFDMELAAEAARKKRRRKG